mmetsp:Transcript_73652/g.227452  ORF Transcript_73652/g.227452 Transcript_73652/m.227452 type:complete len:260 (-) Transcript_73652:485-1264(-)
MRGPLPGRAALRRPRPTRAPARCGPEDAGAPAAPPRGATWPAPEAAPTRSTTRERRGWRGPRGRDGGAPRSGGSPAGAPCTPPARRSRSPPARTGPPSLPQAPRDPARRAPPLQGPLRPAGSPRMAPPAGEGPPDRVGSPRRAERARAGLPAACCRRAGPTLRPFREPRRRRRGAATPVAEPVPPAPPRRPPLISVGGCRPRQRPPLRQRPARHRRREGAPPRCPPSSRSARPYRTPAWPPRSPPWHPRPQALRRLQQE